MAEFENRGFSQTQSTAARTRAHEIDEGLRSYMLRVYNYMALGVAFTAVVTLFDRIESVPGYRQRLRLAAD